MTRIKSADFIRVIRVLLRSASLQTEIYGNTNLKWEPENQLLWFFGTLTDTLCAAVFPPVSVAVMVTL